MRNTRRAPRAALVLALLAAWGCSRGVKGPDPPAEPFPRRPSPGRVAISYQPPPDGRLSERQVELYLTVWDRIRAARKAAAPEPEKPRTFADRNARLGDAIEGEAADVTAARELQVNVEEYLWVKERILEAEAAQMTAKLNADALALLEKTLTDLKVRRAAAADEGSKTLLSEQIANFEAEAQRERREAREKEPEPVQANIRTLERHRGRLAALQEEIDRLGGTAKNPPAAATGAPAPKGP